MSNLVDILSKREYLLRSYLVNEGYSLGLPKTLQASPTNPLFIEVRKSFNFTNLNDYLNENASLCDDKGFFLNAKVDKLFNIISPLNSLYPCLSYLYPNNSSTKGLEVNPLLKSQYRPMRKGISNMIRLHATGAIAMPIEVRLHILASSKDIIHSWAIPSAGIKIDCVPGYSSHRVAIFLVSGIFWGQCMEICGRFHH